MSSVLPFPLPLNQKLSPWNILNTRPQPLTTVQGASAQESHTKVISECPLTHALKEAGLNVLPVPLTVVHPVSFTLTTPVTQFDWLFFTSPNGVKHFFDACSADDMTSLPPIAVVGPGTAEAVQSYGAKVSFCPKTQFTAQAAAEAWLGLSEDEPPGKWVLWPCGEKHRPELATTLKAGGCCIDPVVVYKTEAICPSTTLPENIQVITLSSPFSAQALHQWQSKLSSTLRIACFGASTLKMVQELFPELTPGNRLLLPTENTLQSLAQCIIEAWQANDGKDTSLPS